MLKESTALVAGVGKVGGAIGHGSRRWEQGGGEVLLDFGGSEDR